VQTLIVIGFNIDMYHNLQQKKIDCVSRPPESREPETRQTDRAIYLQATDYCYSAFSEAQLDVGIVLLPDLTDHRCSTCSESDLARAPKQLNLPARHGMDSEPSPSTRTPRAMTVQTHEQKT